MTATIAGRYAHRAGIYDLERGSIEAFVASHRFEGRVLDFGCGLAPYRELVERTAEWFGYDHPSNHGSVLHRGDPLPAGYLAYDPFARGEQWDGILATQCLQYVADPARTLRKLWTGLWPGAPLVITGPSSWHEEEPASMWRFARSGIRRLLEDAGFTVDRLEDRGTVELGGFPISVGWGAVAHA